MAYASHVFCGAVGPVHQKQLHGVLVVEVAGLVQRRPPEVVFLVLVAPSVEERLADLSVTTHNHHVFFFFFCLVVVARGRGAGL